MKKLFILGSFMLLAISSYFVWAEGMNRVNTVKKVPGCENCKVSAPASSDLN